MKRNKSRAEHTSTVPVCSKLPSPRSTSYQRRFPLGVCPILFYIIYTLVSRASQNHRIIKIGTDHWRLSHPASLLKQGPLKHVTQDFVQMAFEYLLERRFHNLSGHPVPVLINTHSKEVLPQSYKLISILCEQMFPVIHLKLFFDNCITFRSSYKTVHHLLILILILYF